MAVINNNEGKINEVFWVGREPYLHSNSFLYKLFRLCYCADDGTQLEDVSEGNGNSSTMTINSVSPGEGDTLDTRLSELSNPLTVIGTTSAFYDYHSVRIELVIQPGNGTLNAAPPLMAAAPEPEAEITEE